MSRTRLASAAGALALGALALFGGEYSTLDWLKLRRQLAREQATVRALQQEIDSLARFVRELETDPLAQERVAREEFGMIRDGEILYRLVAPR